MTYPQQPGNWSDPSGQPQPTSGAGYPPSSGAGYPPPSGPPSSGAGYPPPGGYPTQPGAPGYPGQPPAYGAAPGGYPQPAEGYPPAGYPTPDYAQPQQQYPPYGYGYPPGPSAPGTNGLAIAALVLALVGLVTCGLTAPIGAIMGHVARKQIRERGESGEGLAKGGIIAGWAIFGLAVLGWIGYIVLIVFAVKSADNYPDPYVS